MKRRNFIKKTAAGATMLGLGATATAGTLMGTAATRKNSASNAAKFKLKYAPSLNIFSAHAGKDPMDNLKFIADQGFRASFDLGMVNRPVQEQENIRIEARRLDGYTFLFLYRTGNHA